MPAGPVKGVFKGVAEVKVQEGESIESALRGRRSIRDYEKDPLRAESAPMEASYSGEFTFADGFHPNADGMTRLAEDFAAKFGPLLLR